MSNKKAESGLPADDFTMTDGYNYGLDGFQFDTDYGSGVEDGARLPEAQGLAGLPDGVVTSEDEDFDIPVGVVRDEDEGLGDLTGMMLEGSLAGLGWLNGEQDPDRLPKNPVDRGQMELEEAWGVNRRTDGLQRVPGLDLSVVNYEATLEEHEAPKTASQQDLLRIVRRAMRRSAYGEPLQTIFNEAAQELGHEAYRIKNAMQVVKAEHGLVGRVFIRASAFPGLHNGKWKDTIRRKCASARYIIADDGRDVYGDILKMPVVKEVPWEEAYEFYTPRLTAAGYKVASDLKPQRALRQAFLSDPVVEHQHSAKPIQTRLVDTITNKEARQAFDEAEKLAQEIVDLTDRGDLRVRQAAGRKIVQWVRGGLLSKEDGIRLGKSSADPRTIIQTAADLISAAGKSTYTGSGTQQVKPVHPTREAAFLALSAAEGEISQRQQKVDSAVARKAKLYVDRLHKAGALTLKDMEEVLSLKDPQEIMKKATFLAAVGRKTEVPTQVKKAKKYEGPSFEAAPQKSASYKELSPETQRIIEASEESGIAANEFRGMLRWTRQRMAEGFAGNDLTQLIDVRFTKSLLKAASVLISEMRSEHEGVSGFLYVDADAYASKSGQAGCEKGGSIHRANGIPFVLAMDRCGSCVFANAEGGCQKYNKPLVDRLEGKEHREYQQEMIRQANATDAELTASIFASSYDPQEYGLDNESKLDNFDLETAPEHEDIGDVFFGGIEI